MTSVADHETLDVGGGLTISEAEAALAEIPAHPPRSVRISVDLTRCRHVEAGAGWRLGNAVSGWARHGEVTARIPPPHGFSGPWFQTFTRSGLGLALAAFARRVLAPDADVTEELREYYAARGVKSHRNHVIVASIDDGALVPGIDAFGRTLDHLVDAVSPRDAGLDAPDLAALRELAYEAITNVVDHAFAAPFEGEPGLSYFSMRFYNRLDERAAGYLAEYAARVPPTMERRRRAGWVELVVNDTGVGVAARQSQNREIYRGPIADERDALVDAVSHSSSVKLRARDAVLRGDPGFGYAYIQASLARLRAHAELRTGRTRAVLDGSTGARAFRLADEVLGYLPGTALQIVFPLYRRQLSLV